VRRERRAPQGCRGERPGARGPVCGPAQTGPGSSRAMSARPPTPDQLERWFKRTCVRCGRHAHAAGRWPEGPLCRTCYSHALDTFGRCAGCGVERMVPGLAANGGRLCTECAGIPGDFICRRCNVEGRRYSRGLCPRCFLTEQLAELLDD